MVKSIDSILLATNLQEYNKVAFDVAISMATHYDANLVLLHVLEDLPESVKLQLTKWVKEEELQEKKREDAEAARRALIGKQLTNVEIKSSLSDYCQRRGIDEIACGNPLKEVVVKEGEVVENIVETASEHDCGMIVMAAHEALFDKTAVSRTIRRVLKQSTIPVLIVPQAS